MTSDQFERPTGYTVITVSGAKAGVTFGYLEYGMNGDGVPNPAF